MLIDPAKPTNKSHLRQCDEKVFMILAAFREN